MSPAKPGELTNKKRFIMIHQQYDSCFWVTGIFCWTVIGYIQWFICLVLSLSERLYLQVMRTICLILEEWKADQIVDDFEEKVTSLLGVVKKGPSTMQAWSSSLRLVKKNWWTSRRSSKFRRINPEIPHRMVFAMGQKFCYGSGKSGTPDFFCAVFRTALAKQQETSARHSSESRSSSASKKVLLGEPKCYIFGIKTITWSGFFSALKFGIVWI